jgi:hypothetical protein
VTDGLHAAAEDVSANEIDVEGLVASAGTFASVARKQHILDPLDVYGRVVGNLQRHEPRYPGVDRLRAVAWQGRDGAWGYRSRELIGPGLSRCRVRLSRVGDPTR